MRLHHSEEVVAVCTAECLGQPKLGWVHSYRGANTGGCSRGAGAQHAPDSSVRWTAERQNHIAQLVEYRAKVGYDAACIMCTSDTYIQSSSATYPGVAMHSCVRSRPAACKPTVGADLFTTELCIERHQISVQVLSAGVRLVSQHSSTLCLHGYFSQGAVCGATA